LLVVLVHQFSLAARQIILVGKERQGNRVKAMPADSFVAPKTTAAFDTYASETVSLFRREDKFRAYAALSIAYLSVSSMLPPLRGQRRLQRVSYFGAITRLQHLLPTIQEWCCHHPCKDRFRLAGLPLPGGSRTQSGAPCDGDHGCRSGLSAPAFRLLSNGR
jgi:hypothetical protein